MVRRLKPESEIRPATKKQREFFKKHPEIDVVGGPHLTPKESSYFEKVSGYVLGSIFGAAGSSSRYATGKTTLDADEQIQAGLAFP